MLCKQCLGNLRAKVAKVYAKSVTSVVLDVLQCVHHVDFALDNADRALVNIRRVILFRVRLHQRLSPVDRKRCRETITAYRHDTNFYLR